ncbi:plasmid mobilization protein [Ferruginibacter sp.]
MKKEEKKVRKHFVKTRMNDAELNAVIKLQQKTTEKDISSYLRKIALQKPVTIKYRNQSADDFLNDMLGLKRELNAIGNNFNQAVHKLHLLEKIPDFRQWINQYDDLHKILIEKVEEINQKINRLYEEWLLK